MTEWKYTIDFTYHMHAYQNEEININDMSMRIHQTLKLNNLYGKNDEYDDIVDQLEMIIDPEMTVDDFDYWLSNLYDWADCDHTAWIEPS